MTQSRFPTILWIAGMGLLLITLNGCGKSTSSSVQDQSLRPGETKPQPEPKVAEKPVEQPAEQPAEQPVERPAETVTPPGAPEERVTEPVPPAQPPPPVTEAPVVAQEQPPEAPPSPPLTLSDVFFDFDRAVIRDDAQPLLEANARLLQTDEGRKFVVEGHCDERGTLEYNLVLGERRAQAVKQYLADLGVPSSRMQVTSFGKERPFCTEHNQECWQKNRRAHFSFP